jgi:hypothetical protein
MLKFQYIYVVSQANAGVAKRPFDLKPKLSMSMHPTRIVVY